MKKNYDYIVILFWYLIVAICFYDVATPNRDSIFSFPRQTGHLTLVDQYEKFNLVSLKDSVYLVPHGVDFINPKRTKFMKKKGQMKAASIEEGYRMIDQNKENIADRLVFVKKINFLNVYQKSNLFIIVPEQSFQSKKTGKNYSAYREIILNTNYENMMIEANDL